MCSLFNTQRVCVPIKTINPVLQNEFGKMIEQDEVTVEV